MKIHCPYPSCDKEYDDSKFVPAQKRLRGHLAAAHELSGETLELILDVAKKLASARNPK